MPPTDQQIVNRPGPSTDPDLNFRIAVSELLKPMRADIAAFKEYREEFHKAQQATRNDVSQNIRTLAHDIDNRLHKTNKAISNLTATIDGLVEVVQAVADEQARVRAERERSLWSRIASVFRRPDPE